MGENWSYEDRKMVKSNEDYESGTVEIARPAYARFTDSVRDEVTTTKRFIAGLLIGGLITLLIIGIRQDTRYLYLIGLILGIIVILAMIVSIIIRLFQPNGYVSVFEIFFLDDFIYLLVLLGKIFVQILIQIITKK